MARQTGSEESPVRTLEHLMSLEYDVEEASQAAIDGLADPRFQQQLERLRADTRRHLEELGPLIRRLGGRPPGGPDLHGRLEEGRLRIAQLGGDDAILRAMRRNLEAGCEAYRRALAEAPEAAQELLGRAREEEQRHYEWLVEAVRALEAAPHRGGPPWNIPPPSGM